MLMLMITTAIIIFLCIFTPPPAPCVVTLGPSRIGLLQRLKNVTTVPGSPSKVITVDYQLSGSWRRCWHCWGRGSEKGGFRSWHYTVYVISFGASYAITLNETTAPIRGLLGQRGWCLALLVLMSHSLLISPIWIGSHLLRVTNSIFSRAARSAFFRTDLSFYFLSSRKLTLILTVWISVLLLLWIGIFISAFLFDFQT